MKLKSAGATTWERRVIGGLRIIGRERRRSFLAILACLALLAAFVAGAAAYRARLHLIVHSAAAARLDIASNTLRGLLASPERLVIDIAHEDFLKLANQREEALSTGLLMVDEDDYVPARVRLGETEVKVKLRLKGDHVDHLDSQRWSFRVRVSGEHTILGMKQFSLHHPKTRSYAYEWLFHRAMRREDILALRYDFVDVTVNGRHLGLYAMEEHFEKRLVEHNHRREGPILRFDENEFWAEQLKERAFAGQGRLYSGEGSFIASEIDAFQSGGIVEDPALREQFALAAGRIDAFRKGELDTMAVFDGPRLATYFALIDLLGAEHAARWHNIRFYFNPLSTRLEPIAFDAFETTGWQGWQDSGPPYMARRLVGVHLVSESALRRRIFADPAFYRAYVGELERVSDPAYLDALFDEVGEELQAKLDLLYSEFPYYRFDRDLIAENQRYIRTVLRPARGLQSRLIEAAWADGATVPPTEESGSPVGDSEARGGDSSEPVDLRIDVELGNIQNLPLEVVGLSVGDAPSTSLETPILLPPRLGDDPVRFERRSLPLRVDRAALRRAVDPDGTGAALQQALPELRFVYGVLGADAWLEEPLLALPVFDEARILPHLVLETAALDDFPFLTLEPPAATDDAAGPTAATGIRIEPGSHLLDRDLVIPAGHRLQATGAITLDLRNGASIISRSPLWFQGSPAAPVRVISSDGTGGGLFVSGADAPSKLVDVVFSGLQAPSAAGWAPTGAVTFEASDVVLERVAFVNMQAEDALNIVRAKLELADCRFEAARSDALDVDFGWGSLRRISFIKPGNDGLDLSGSEVDARDLVIVDAGDKAISVGEESRLTGGDFIIRGGRLGIAGKDRSTLSLGLVRIEGSRVGVAAYQKKPEFGPGELRLDELHLENVETPYLIERGSSLLVGGVATGEAVDAVYDRLYSDAAPGAGAGPPSRSSPPAPGASSPADADATASREPRP